MLAVLCAERGITQKEIAARTGMRPATLSNLSQGKLGGIEFETMALICEALGCGLGDLFQLVPARESAGRNGGKEDQPEQLQPEASGQKPEQATSAGAKAKASGAIGGHGEGQGKGRKG